MEIDKLLENLAVISQILQTPSLTNQIDKDPEFGKKIKEFETLVEKFTKIKFYRKLTTFNLVTFNYTIEGFLSFLLLRQNFF